MSDNLNVIYDISQKMLNPAQTQNDISDAASIITRMFRERYVDRLNTALNQYMESSRQNPPKEAGLLYSLKPFMSESAHEQADKAADMFIFMDAVRKLSGTKAAALSENPGESDLIHNDGVYEIDEQCLKQQRPTEPQKNLMAALMLLMTSLGKR